MSDAESLEWVTEPQRTALEQAAGSRGDWSTWLPEDLDLYWPEWRAAQAQELEQFLDGLLPSLAGAAGPAPAEDTASGAGVADLVWVTAQQAYQLEALAATRGGEWQEWLPAELDALWPDWRSSDAATLGPWLDTVLPSLGAPSDSAEPTPDASDLSWVTAGQSGQLDELFEVRGDWRQWLPAELDSRWPEWQRSDSATLVPWLDGLIPTLVMPGASEEDIAGLFKTDDTAAFLQALAADGLDDLDADTLAELIREAADQVLSESAS